MVLYQNTRAKVVPFVAFSNSILFSNDFGWFYQIIEQKLMTDVNKPISNFSTGVTI